MLGTSHILKLIIRSQFRRCTGGVCWKRDRPQLAEHGWRGKIFWLSSGSTLSVLQEESFSKRLERNESQIILLVKNDVAPYCLQLASSGVKRRNPQPPSHIAKPPFSKPSNRLFTAPVAHM